MSKSRKIVYGITFAVLFICTALLVYSIAADSLGKHNIMRALAIAAGFIALKNDKREKN